MDMGDGAASEIDWLAIEEDYRDPTVPFREILRRHGITNHRFYAHADKHGWPRRRPRKSPPPRAGYELKRLAQALRARVVKEVEAGDDAVTDRCVTSFLKLVQAEEKIAAMERAAKQARKPIHEDTHDDDIVDEATEEADQASIDRYFERRVRYEGWTRNVPDPDKTGTEDGGP